MTPVLTISKTLELADFLNHEVIVDCNNQVVWLDDMSIYRPYSDQTIIRKMFDKLCPSISLFEPDEYEIQTLLSIKSSNHYYPVSCKNMPIDPADYYSELIRAMVKLCHECILLDQHRNQPR